MYKEVVEPEVSVSNKINPNFPFEVTQEEFIAHIRRIERGDFTPLEEANREFEEWRKEYHAKRSK